MKIAYISDSMIPSKRANSVHVMHMCNAFHKNGHEVILYGLGKRSQNFQETRKWYGVENFKIDLTSLRIPKFTLRWHAQRILRRVRKEKPDLIFGRSLFGSSLLAERGFNVLFETHDPLRTMNGQQKKALFKMLRSGHLQGIVVLSEALKQILLEEIPELKAENVLAVHDGATVRNHQDYVLDSYKWPCKPGTRAQVGYLGTISPGRGIEMILDLAKKNPDQDFHIVGGTKDDLTELGLNPESASENLYFHGFVSPDNAAIARKKCDVLLAPYQESITLRSGKNTVDYMSPLKIFEYMEAGKAIICSDLPVLREVLESDSNCLFCGPESLASWNDALKKLVQNKELRQNLGKKAREDVMVKYNWSLRAKSILNFANV